jgi:integrase
MKGSAGDEPQLFPGRGANDAQGDIKRFWASVCRSGGISGARIHDLRHTHASILASDGASLPLIGALLGHTQVSTTARYAHLLDDPLRAATERAGAVIMGAAKPKSQVVNRPQHSMRERQE